MKLWRARQFEYQWLRLIGGNYKNFQEITEDALVFTARGLNLALTARDREAFMSLYSNLPVWPDVEGTVNRLKEKGYKVVFLSNMTEEMLFSGLKTSGLRSKFDGVLSTDSQKTFKPSPQAYQIALDKLHLLRAKILFVAFAGWDAAGAKWFGYPTFWVNRTAASVEELDNTSDGTGPNLQSLLDYLDGDLKKANQSPAVFP